MREKHGMTGTIAHSRWKRMIQRCEDSNDSCFKNYGGRGISVFPLWRESFGAYYADVGDCPGPGLSLDRRDNDGDYEPSNMRWADRHTQRMNQRLCSCGPSRQRQFVAVDCHGNMVISDNQSSFARDHGLDRSAISKCFRGIRKTVGGWTFRWTQPCSPYPCEGT